MSFSYRLTEVLNLLGVKTSANRDSDVIRASHLFDEDWYRQQLPDAVRSVRDPVLHYVCQGARKGRNPHPLFDTEFYRANLSVIDRRRFNPLVHYITQGGADDRRPCWWFDSAWYRAFHEVAGSAEVTPLLEYWQTGQREGRSTHPLFESAWYERRYAGHLSHANPVVDYIYSGTRAGRVPHRALDGADRVPAVAEEVERVVRAAEATRDPPSPKGLSARTFKLKESEAFIADMRRRTAALANAPPTVSIIMPTRDRAGLLKAAIDSVLGQTYEAWELLIVDDGSTDGTRELVGGLSDKRVRYIAGEGKGAASARNAGIAQARGELVAYLDSDNRWVPEFLETMVGYLLWKDLDLAYSGMKLDSEEGIRYRGRRFVYADLVKANYIDLNAILHRRALVERFGAFDASLRRMIDWDLVLRYTRNTKVGYAPFIGVLYDEHKREDRITVRESISWRFVVLNRYLIDWDRLTEDAAKRDEDLVSIVIPVYGNFGITNACIESIFENRGVGRFEIVLVNSKSDEATLANMALWEKARSNVKLEAGWINFNFALGCNVGFARSSGATVVFLNNDTLVTPGWLDPLAEELRGGTIGAVQPKLLYPDGTVQSIGAAFSDRGAISYMLYREEPGDAPHVNRRRELQAIHGACIAVRAGDFARLRGFDPHFVNGQEDIDFCLRLTAETGKRVAVVPQSTVIHLEGKSPGRSRYVRQNRALFVERWKDRIKADDAAIYREDGFSVDSYEPDSEEYARRGIAAYTPKLSRAIAFPAAEQQRDGA